MPARKNSHSIIDGEVDTKVERIEPCSEAMVDAESDQLSVLQPALGSFSREATDTPSLEAFKTYNTEAQQQVGGDALCE